MEHTRVEIVRSITHKFRNFLPSLLYKVANKDKGIILEMINLVGVLDILLLDKVDFKRYFINDIRGECTPETVLSNAISSTMQYVTEDYNIERCLPIFFGNVRPVLFGGFSKNNITFSENGTKGKVFKYILSEMLKNALRFSDPMSRTPISLHFEIIEENIVITCANQSTKKSRSRDESKGAAMGIPLMMKLTEMLDGKFEANVFSDDSVVRVTIPSVLN